jgi:SAM-dependent methyltransferase
MTQSVHAIERSLAQPSDLLRLGASIRLASHDEMLDGAALDHYFGSGMSAAWAIDNIIRCRSAVAADPSFPAEVLDFGSGCGRVARFIRALYPHARVHVADLRQEDARWCVNSLGCVPAPDRLPQQSYDLIWLGSVFTHLPEKAARELLSQLLRSLKDYGVLAFSTQGRFAHWKLKNIDWIAAAKHTWMSYGLDKIQVQHLINQYEDSGYGYVNYPAQEGYGVCIANAEWYSTSLRNIQDVTQIFFQERAYDDHQDVIAFMNRQIGSAKFSVFEALGRRMAALPKTESA